MNLGLSFACIFGVVILVSTHISIAKVMAKSGREFRAKHQNAQIIRGRALLAAYYQRTNRRRSYAASPIRYYRRGYLQNSLPRRSLVPVRPRILARTIRLAENQTTGNRRLSRQQKPQIAFQTKHGNNKQPVLDTKKIIKESVSRISRRRQQIINRCKYIKTGKCCNGWSKHSVTGYCMPSCSKSCVHGVCESGHSCKCKKGFTGPICNLDMNECANNICEQGCLNTYGSYRCICNPGFALQNGGRCTKIHPCKLKKCEHKCYMDAGDAKCVCPRGYRLAANGTSCKDINECTESDIKCHGADDLRTCRNVPGSYFCACDSGYFYHRYFKTCSDSNECLTETHKCNLSISKCVNTKGGYRCDCKDNFVGDGIKCDGVHSNNKMSINTNE